MYFVFFLGVCDWQVIDSLLGGHVTDIKGTDA